jgi:hypothetical protein
MIAAWRVLLLKITRMLEKAGLGHGQPVDNDWNSGEGLWIQCVRWQKNRTLDYRAI